MCLVLICMICVSCCVRLVCVILIDLGGCDDVDIGSGVGCYGYFVDGDVVGVCVVCCCL